MDLDFNKNRFMELMDSDFVQLPITLDRRSYKDTLIELFHNYTYELQHIVSKDKYTEINDICNLLLRVIDKYHNGLPSGAFEVFSQIMKLVIDKPVRIYQKSYKSNSLSCDAKLNLYRIRNVYDYRQYERNEIFHTPFNMRTKINTSRYSIAGYPCLYLSTDLKLCCEETKKQSINQITIASKFNIVGNYLDNNNTDIDVIELGIKPKHFVSNKNNQNISTGIDLSDIELMSNYLYWYPIIAASSVIRVNKEDPFSSEYIIPQLLMQWIRLKACKERLYGIRYFSCASDRASEAGYNYVFPAYCSSNIKSNYCRMLSKAFKLTKPVMLHNYESISDCQLFLVKDTDLNTIEL